MSKTTKTQASKSHTAKPKAPKAAKEHATPETVDTVNGDGTTPEVGEPKATIRLKHRHPVGVNGRIRHLPGDEDVDVTADELHALKASDVEFEIKVPLPDTDAGEDSGSGSPESSADQPEAEEAAGDEAGEQPAEATTEAGENAQS